MIVIEINDLGDIDNVFADNHGEEVLYITWHGREGQTQPVVYLRKVKPITQIAQAFVPPHERDED